MPTLGLWQGLNNCMHTKCNVPLTQGGLKSDIWISRHGDSDTDESINAWKKGIFVELSIYIYMFIITSPSEIFSKILSRYSLQVIDGCLWELFGEKSTQMNLGLKKTSWPLLWPESWW